MSAKIYGLHVLSPLHIGAGQGVGFIDLPIMREKVTGWPIVPGSSIKGVMRDHFSTGADPALFAKAFGHHEQAGSLVYTDARIVLLPVRSYFGTFAYATSSMALQRLKRDLVAAELSNIPPDIPDADVVRTLQASKVAHEGKVCLEEYDYPNQTDEHARTWGKFLAKLLFAQDRAWAGLFEERFAILPDDAFNFFCETGTEVQARIRIDEETRTVARGSLWYEESLPAESILMGTVWCDRVYGEKSMASQHILDAFCGQELQVQLGGKATVGKGRVRCIFAGREG